MGKYRNKNRDSKLDKRKKRTESKSDRNKEVSVASAPRLVARTVNQQKVIDSLNTDQLTCAFGSAGTGKTYLACTWAISEYLKGNVDNILITRANKVLGNYSGAVKGNDGEKIINFCMSMLMVFKKHIGGAHLKCLLNMELTDLLFNDLNGGITLLPIEKVQGLSFGDRTIVIADEVQNATPAQIKSLLTRPEEGCKVILMGDPNQSAFSSSESTKQVEKIISDRHMNSASVINMVAEQDDQRKGIAKEFTIGFEKLGGW